MKDRYDMVKCFWCAREFEQRKDTIERQSNSYGHTCCKSCFGKEPSFKAKRTFIMLTNNPFKGRSHSSATKDIIAKKAKGKKAWNLGLTKENTPSINKAALYLSETLKGKRKGADNSNWKGGISLSEKYKKWHNTDRFKKWMLFRKEIIANDCNKCFKCNDRFNHNQIDIHHILSQTEYPELVFDELNCASLCRSCHKSFHKEYGRKGLTVMDFLSWINEERELEEYFSLC